MNNGVRTPGIILAVGASIKSSATDATLSVLEIRTHRDRHDDTDFLPFVPAFRKHLTPLPQLKKHISTKTLHVKMSELVCLTKHVTKGVLPGIFGGEHYTTAKDKLHQICQTWNSDIWEEIDLGRIRSLAIHDIIGKRREAEVQAIKSPAAKCKSFLKHYAMCHDQWVIKKYIAELQGRLSEQNLQLLPDYNQRIEVLRELHFIDKESRIQLKGKVACEIHSGDELVLTELILENVLADYEPAEIAALLSAFVFQEKTSSVPRLTANLERGMQTIVGLSEKVINVQTVHQVIQSSEESNDFVSKPRFGLMEVVYEWARGMSFKNITNLTDVLEGTIVRTITRLDETCREVKNAARIIGDPDLYQKMAAAQEMIRRDITAVASLYM
jgi:antiviral helicase SKI2